MQVRIILLCLFCMSVSGTVTIANAQSIVSDSEKQKQWKSMENVRGEKRCVSKFGRSENI